MGRLFNITVTAAVLGVGPAAMAKPHLTVAYAGSMGVVMDRYVGPAFAAKHHCRYRGIGQGAWALARLIGNKRMRPDVFVSITAGPMAYLQHKKLVRRFRTVASTQMVIAYSPRSRFKKALALAASGKKPWYKVLETPGLRFGRTDPRTDPQGRNIIFTFLLAQRYYKKPAMMRNILGRVENPRQIFSEPSLLARLEAGQIDAASGYLSAVKSRHLPYITLPAQINLSKKRLFTTWYSKVGFTLRGVNGAPHVVRPQPLVFCAAVPLDARHKALARKFIAYLRHGPGRAMLKKTGYAPAALGAKAKAGQNKK